MIHAISYRIKRFLFFYDSIVIRSIVVLGLFVSTFLVLMSILSNPFSKYNYNDEIDDICIEADINKIVLNSEKIQSTNSKSTYIYQSQRIYTYNDDDYWIVDTTGHYSNNEIKIKQIYHGWSKHVPLADIKLCNLHVHPLPFYHITHNNDLFLLGTTNNGYDLFSKILHNISVTIKLSLWTLVSFLLIGISMGIFLGYYKNRFPNLYLLVNYIQKIIESIPVILWMIITINLMNVTLDKYIDWQWQINFFMFGIYSSTALSKLLVDKFENFRNEDFIVALKLLGISDFRVIFIHILRYQCMPIIVLQITYIIAQCIYLDMTLSVIEFNLGNSIGKTFSNVFYLKDSWGQDQIVALTLMIYLLLSTLFYCSIYFKEKIK